MIRSLTVVSLLASVALTAYADGPGLSLRIVDEAAPAGSTVQIKVEVTEAKPISTGRGKIKPGGLAMVVGIFLMNEGQDTYGVAMVNEDGLTFDVVSPSSIFGTAADYPILGIAGTIAPGAANGSTFPLTIDPAGLGFRDGSGAAYPTEIQDGTLTVSPGAIAIGDVNPGSAVVPAGGIVRITGANFTPQTRLQLSETDISEQRFVNSGRIDVTLAQPTRMHGLRIRARNEGKTGEQRSEAEYFSYERTTPAATTNDPILSRTVPLFAPATHNTATVTLPRRAVGGKRRAVRPSYGSRGASTVRTGVALQNLHSSTATVAIELLDAAGHPYAVNTVSIGPDQHLVREIAEVFGVVAPPSAFRIRSNLPIQVLGLTADPATGTATALPPQ